MRGQLIIDNAQIGWLNFEGREQRFNKAGERNFVVFLDNELADELAREGWNVKYPKPKEFAEGEEDNRQPYLKVKVSYRYNPPKVVLIAGGNPTMLEEPEVGMIDWAERERVDLVIRPYQSPLADVPTAYLKSAYITIVDDPFTQRYGI